MLQDTGVSDQFKKRRLPLAQFHLLWTTLWTSRKSAHTADTGRTFHWFLLSCHFSWWDMSYGSKSHRVLSTCTKTYRPKMRKLLSSKWDTTCLFMPPWGRQWFPPSLPPHFTGHLQLLNFQGSNINTRKASASGLHQSSFAPRMLHAKSSEAFNSQTRCFQFTVPWRRRDMVWCCSQLLTKLLSHTMLIATTT